MQQTETVAKRLESNEKLIAVALLHYPRDRFTLHEAQCPILRLGVCRCDPIIIQPTASA